MDTSQQHDINEIDRPDTPEDLAAMIAALPHLQPHVRARHASVLIEDTKRILSQARRAAIVEMTHTHTYTETAAELGVSVSTVNKAVTEHRRKEPSVTSTTSRDEYRQRVAKGAALLDQAVPGWQEHIDPERLSWRQNWWRYNVLGQLGASLSGPVANGGVVDGHTYMVKRLKLDAWGPISHGFDVFESHPDDELDVLTDVWREYLSQQPTSQ